jgi:hypothetical protein
VRDLLWKFKPQHAKNSYFFSIFVRIITIAATRFFAAWEVFVREGLESFGGAQSTTAQSVVTRGLLL